jgi:hypothetical protein
VPGQRGTRADGGGGRFAVLTQRNPVEKKRGDGWHCPGRLGRTRRAAGRGPVGGGGLVPVAMLASASGSPSTKCPWRHGSHVMDSCVVAVRARPLVRRAVPCALLVHFRARWRGSPSPAAPHGPSGTGCTQRARRGPCHVLALGHSC